MATLFDEVAAAVRALELSANTFRLLASDERTRAGSMGASVRAGTEPPLLVGGVPLSQLHCHLR